MVTKLAPLRLASLMMGVWFLINFVANWLAGIIGSFAEQLGELTIFGGIAATLFVFAVVLWLFSGTLVRWMHGAENSHALHAADLRSDSRSAGVPIMSRTLRSMPSSRALMPVDRAARCRGIAQAETADEFVARINRELAELGLEGNAAGWTQATYINVDTEFLNAKATERFLEYFSKAVEEAKAYDGQPMSPASKRALELLKLGVAAPAPDDPAKRAELAELTAEDGSHVRRGASTARRARSPAGTRRKLKTSCANEPQLRRAARRLEGWHTIARPMRADYERFVELANEGARELGFEDLGAMWRSGYDMPPEDFDARRPRACGAGRSRSTRTCTATRAAGCREVRQGQGARRQADPRAPARQHVGAAVGRDLRRCSSRIPACSDLDVDRRARRSRSTTRCSMTKSAESFYTSIGFPALPETFWERSMLTQPRDRDVVCHASAWDMDGKDDVRIKMCIKPTRRTCSPSTTSSATSITTSSTRTSRTCSRTARTTASTRPSATRSTCR